MEKLFYILIIAFSHTVLYAQSDLMIISKPEKTTAENIKKEALCNEENATACHEDALVFLNQKPINYKKATELLAAACDSKHSLSCLKLGTMYEGHQGVKQDLIEAYVLYDRACEDDLFEACSNLARLNKKGFDIKPDLSKTLYFYKKACEGDDAKGCTNLGFMYYKAEGVKKNLSLAEKYFVKGCELDNYTGCFNAGYIYENGEGVKRDLLKAANLYRKACNGKIKEACLAHEKMRLF
ncbi:MAG: sel1 repeat family protein [Campylobacteraceae bacterium]|nr:sel1 repeat family protein [Campylobacteraceae bacterium]